MARQSLLTKATNWSPNPDDEHGNAKLRLISFLISECQGFENAKSIQSVLKGARLTKKYSKEKAQHLLIVPLREVNELFIGTSQKGIYLVTNATDAHVTMTFYRKRIFAEKKHQLNLKKLIDTNKLYLKFNANFPTQEKTRIYLDESGNPDVTYTSNGSYFVVTAVIVFSRKAHRELEIRLNSIKELLNKPENFEFKHNKLRPSQIEQLLIELSHFEYWFASIVLRKSALRNGNYDNPKKVYKQAFKMLIDRILINLPLVSIFYDEYGSRNSNFQDEFFKYMLNAKIQYPSNQITNQEMINSAENPFIQLADILCGVVKNKVNGNDNHFKLIQERLLDLIIFPYERTI